MVVYSAMLYKYNIYFTWLGIDYIYFGFLLRWHAVAQFFYNSHGGAGVQSGFTRHVVH
jgi:hypothetical protein